MSQNFQIQWIAPKDSNFSLFKSPLAGISQATPPSFGYFQKGLVVERQNQVMARIGIYQNPYWEKFQGRTCVFLGAYAAMEDPEAVRVLFQTLARELHQQGIELMIGPLDGSTWATYRFRAPSAYPRFFLEPMHPDYYLKQWQTNGFGILQAFQSNLTANVRLDNSKMDVLSQRFDFLTIRSFNHATAVEDLQQLAQLNLKAFRKNFLYSPIDEITFVAQYQKMLPLIDPDFCYLAFDEKKLVGFIFALPNQLDPEGKTLIVKTVARNLERKYAGLSRLLYSYILEAMQKCGFEYCIHALMRSDNASVGVSKHFNGQVIRQYYVLSKTVENQEK